MRWYCKFCKLFTEVDYNHTCNNCQIRNTTFEFIDNDDINKSQEIILIDQIKNEN